MINDQQAISKMQKIEKLLNELKSNGYSVLCVNSEKLVMNTKEKCNVNTHKSMKKEEVAFCSIYPNEQKTNHFVVYL